LAEEIIRVAERAAQLTSRLLGFARRSKAQSTPTELNQLIVRVGSILERTIDRRITMRLESDVMPHWVRADPAQLESAVLNLALNARDAMPEGGTLSISVRAVELTTRDIARATLAPGQEPPAPGKFIELAVRDTGTGIAERLRGKIFEPFFTTKDVGKGSGLGLAAVLGAARAHHGTLEMESEMEKGTVFKLSLPALANAPQGAETVIESEKPRTSVAARILLVDDDDAVGNAGRLLLEDEGYAVVLAKSGREALEVLALDAKPFNLLIMDMIMPEMSGREAIARARELSPKLPIMIVSGYSSAIDGEVEADGFLHKPYTRRELMTQVERLLQAKPTRRARARS
jgi:two-component system cell cycle sensor histidine kinase/response regulator CckA